MPGSVSMSFVWNGEEIAEKGTRCMNRALAELGLDIALDAKDLAYVRSGTNQRAIHVAARDEGHESDEDMAKAGLDLLSDQVLLDEAPPEGIEVGSWTSYAILEEQDRGRPFIGPAYEQNQDKWDEKLEKQFNAESW